MRTVPVFTVRKTWYIDTVPVVMSPNTVNLWRRPELLKLSDPNENESSLSVYLHTFTLKKFSPEKAKVWFGAPQNGGEQLSVGYLRGTVQNRSHTVYCVTVIRMAPFMVHLADKHYTTWLSRLAFQQWTPEKTIFVVTFPHTASKVIFLSLHKRDGFFFSY